MLPEFKLKIIEIFQSNCNIVLVKFLSIRKTIIS